MQNTSPFFELSQVQSVRRQLEELEQELHKLAGARQLGTIRCGKCKTQVKCLKTQVPQITSQGLNAA